MATRTWEQEKEYKARRAVEIRHEMETAIEAHDQKKF